jgi:hypothetical protein
METAPMPMAPPAAEMVAATATVAATEMAAAARIKVV